MSDPFSGNQSILNPHGPHADVLARMSWLYVGGGLAVWGIVMVILAIAVFRARRGTFLTDEGSKKLLIWAGTGVPLAVLIAFLFHSVITGQRLHAKGTGMRDALQIRISGRQWWWDVYYLNGERIIARVANEMHIPVGKPVVLELETNDVIHSFWVPALGGKMDLIPGRRNHVWLQAEKTGVFRGQCAEYCGVQHAHMGIEVVAEAPEQFARWLDWQGKPAAPPATVSAIRGQQIFMSAPCALCHAIRGTAAAAQFGPDLTHVAGRKWLAAATLPHNRGSMAGWIASAQEIKPGNQMPKITLPPEDLQSLLDYLEGLR